MTSIYDIPLKLNNGTDLTLEQYKDKVIVLVNVASKCGLTGQYTALQKVYQEYEPKGVVVIGLPSNDFLGQEPGSDEEVLEFCSVTYNVTFPLLKKSPVLGENKHPLVARLEELQPVTIDRDATTDGLKANGIPTTEAPDIAWNFEKFIISKDGTKVIRYAPSTAPDAEPIIATINTFLE